MSEWTRKLNPDTLEGTVGPEGSRDKNLKKKNKTKPKARSIAKGTVGPDASVPRGPESSSGSKSSSSSTYLPPTLVEPSEGTVGPEEAAQPDGTVGPEGSAEVPPPPVPKEKERRDR